jgi:hypothetical protein
MTQTERELLEALKAFVNRAHFIWREDDEGMIAARAAIAKAEAERVEPDIAKLIAEEMRYYHDGHYMDSSDAKCQLMSFAERVRRLYTTPPAAAVSEPWQPIETAPKDFLTIFDGWNGERVADVSWAHPEYSPKGYHAWCISEYTNGHGWDNVEVKGLTHWMPLPPAPSGVNE